VFASVISVANRQTTGGATPPTHDAKAARESSCPTISSEDPGGFENDPDDPANPNEAIERSRRKLRPSPLRSPSK